MSLLLFFSMTEEKAADIEIHLNEIGMEINILLSERDWDHDLMHRVRRIGFALKNIRQALRDQK